MLDLLQLGSAFSLRSFARLGSMMAVLDVVQIGSALALRSFGRVGSALSVYSAARFGFPALLSTPRETIARDSLREREGFVNLS